MVISYTLVRVEPSKDHLVHENVKNLPNIKEVITTYGEFDMIVKSEVESLEILDDFVFNKLRVIEGIESTTTLINAKFPKKR